MLITFEGIDGVGKSTQLQLLSQWLTPSPKPIVCTAQPGGCELSRRIRNVILSGSMSGVTELLLFAADRSAHVNDVIRPALLAGGVVLCDRYTDSTYAYQGWGQGFGDRSRLALIEQLNHVSTDGLRPKLTLWLDASVRDCQERLLQRGNPNRMDALPLSFFERARKGYEQLATKNADRIVRVDATADAATVHDEIRAIVRRQLGLSPVVAN